MKNDFIALDFETSYGHIPCSIGIVHFSNGSSISEYYSLIKPIDLKFSPINTRIHGICENDVLNEREFCDIWKEIEHYFHNQNIVAHNASTDIAILEKTLAHYKIPSPNYRSFCTLNIARSMLNLDNYKLSTLAEFFQIEQKNYHNALDDARVCGQLFKYMDTNAFEYIYNGSQRKKNKHNIPTIKINKPIILKESNILDGKTFLFTGKLTLFTREQAEDLVEKHGGKNISAVSKNLHYLVAGEKAGSKLKKAQAIPTIQVIDEQQFLDLLQ